MRTLLLFFLIYTSVYDGIAQVTPKKSQLKIQGLKEYRLAVKKDKKKALVEIKKVIPTVKLDIRYATTNNFMHQIMYKQARAFARAEVVGQLKKIQAYLKKKGYGLKIFDGYRPYQITVAFYQKASDKNFVANPAKGSIHNRGCAIDLTLIDLKTGKDLVMPTPYDSFSSHAAANYPKISPLALKNRTLLITTMQKFGFNVMPNEWWHFDYQGWQHYELMDIPFELL